VKLALVDEFCPALVRDTTIFRLNAALPEIMGLPGRLRLAELIGRWGEFKGRVQACLVGEGIPLGSVVLRAPIPRPTKLLCAQLSFREGVADAAVKPAFFLKSSSSVIGPGEVVQLPPVDAPVFHHEAELALVIGERAKDVSAAEAMRHVFGYTCFMDISARGIGPGTAYQDKSYDTFGPMGPWILSADEIADPHALQVRLWVDGELRHDYPMSDIGNPIGKMIAYASSIAALEPGDVLAMGVNHQGIGPVQDGESLRIEIEPIGAFEVTVSDTLGRKWHKGIDSGVSEAVLRMVRGQPLGAVRFAARLDRDEV
jgi:2-keto-4-pentenoate hydratase/2-oxohepta-3-ene-1,7-dioic acid hydratase in catechol pathway